MNANEQTVVTPQTIAAPGSAMAIFLSFSRAALLGFGGMLPQIFHELVNRRRWLTPAQFAEAQVIGQALPGPAIANMGIALGYRWAGIRGGLAALAGTMGTPSLVVVGVGYAFMAWGDAPAVKAALFGMAAVAAGLLGGTGLRPAAIIGRRWSGWLVVLAFFVSIGVMRWSFPIVFAILGPLSILVAWWSMPDG